MTQISVVVCTHNPRLDYLERTLAGLKEQDLQLGQWELLLIDNASTNPLAESIGLGWHPRGRVVVESELGLTPARARGIRESEAPLILFVDDDNVLEPGFLRIAARIAAEHPNLASWGGRVDAEFEVEPAAWLAPLLPSLAIRDIRETMWSNYDYRSRPIGAGLCIRREFALAYLEDLENSPARRQLDRKGQSLLGAGDYDMVEAGRRRGMGCGVFPELRITHLIPKRRLDPAYLERLVEGNVASEHFLGLLNNPPERRASAPRKSAKRRLFEAALDRIAYLGSSRGERLRLKAHKSGRALGEKLYREYIERSASR